MSLTIAKGALADAAAFLETAGSWGREGTGFLAGYRAGDSASALRFFAPDQVGDSAGRCVEVTERGKLELAACLRLHEVWIARIHSHPAEAFHSTTDDNNYALSAQGAWSIVVPYYGLGLRRGIGACAVHRLVEGTWRRLSSAQLSREVCVA
jgi:hypothetical protein